MKGDGIALIEQGLAFGGGHLQNFGINSNTSANGFIKCLYKRRVSNLTDVWLKLILLSCFKSIAIILIIAKDCIILV